MKVEVILYQSVMQNNKPVQQLSNLVLDGLSTNDNTLNTDNSGETRGKLYGSLTFAGGTYTVNLYKDITRDNLVASGSSTGLGSVIMSAQNSSGLSGTVNIVQYVQDDNTIEAICFLAKDSDLPMNNLEGLRDYDDQNGFATFHLLAFNKIKEIVVSRYRYGVFDPDYTDANAINSGKGGYNLSRVLNWFALREGAAQCAFAWIAEKQFVEPDGLWDRRQKEAKNIFRAHMEQIALSFDSNNDRVSEGQRGLRTWKIARA